MTHGETQDVARSPACRRMKTNLREPYTPPKVPNRPVESPPPPPPRITREEKVNPGEKELHSVARSKVKTNPRTRSTPRKIKAVMTHEETQGVARSPSCCSKSRSTPERTRRPRSPEGRPKPRCPPQVPNGEIAQYKEPSSRAGTRTSRSRKTSARLGQAQAGHRAQAALKPNSHHSHSPLSRSAKDRGTMARVDHCIRLQ